MPIHLEEETMSFDVLAKLSLFFFFSFLTTTPLAAEDVILITADRIQSTLDKSSSSIKVIDSKEIKKSLSSTLPELLAKESDINIVTSGPNGSNSSLFLRGTDSSHTLVLVDGIMMNDPSNPNRQFDIGRLSLNNIEKIEILKGSQGLAYGSNAIGGVIAITTKKAKSNQWTGEQFLDYGSFNTVNTGANFQKKFERVNFSFGADFLSSSGFSAANSNVNPGADNDANQRLTLSMKSNVSLSEAYSMDISLLYDHNQADIDKGGGASNDDPNDTQKEEEMYSKLEITKDWEYSDAETKFFYTRSTHFRRLEVLPDTLNPESKDTRNKGEVNTLALNHTYYLSERLTQNLNIDWQHEKDQSKHFNQNLSEFLYHQYELPNSIFNFGVRLDHNRIFNDHLTYKLAAGYKMDGGLFKVSYATGFRSPSINQLFDPDYGNKDLLPETSQSTELSFEKKWGDSFKTTSSFFYTKIANRLTYDTVTFINKNGGKAEIIGVEQSSTVKWREELTQMLSLTLLKTHDLARGKKLARRPDINLKNTFFYVINDHYSLDYELTYVGQRLDVNNDGLDITNKAYLLSNLNYRFELDKNKDFYLKIKNLFNKEYEEIYGYGTSGRAITVGARYQF